MLLLNLLVYFLPLASADRAFRDYSSLDEILAAADAGLPEGQEILVIEFRDNIRESPIFRPWDELLIEDSTGKSRGADSFGKMFSQLGYRSGFRCSVTARACRRWALMGAGEVPSIL